MYQFGSYVEPVFRVLELKVQSAIPGAEPVRIDKRMTDCALGHHLSSSFCGEFP